VRGHVVAAPAGDPHERVLESRILERLDLAAVVADEMVMMLATRFGALEPRDTIAEVDTLDET